MVVALDGIAEFIDISHGTAGPWPHNPARIGLHATEGKLWLVELTTSGSHPSDGQHDTDADLHGSASNLLLTLHGHGPLDNLRSEGDRAHPGEPLGAVLTFAAVGRGPFGTGAAHPLMFRTVHEAPDLSGVPPRLRDVVAQCLAMEPAGRPSVPEVLERFAALNPGRPPGTGQAFEADWVPGPLARTVRDQAPGELEALDSTVTARTDPPPRTPSTRPATSLSNLPADTTSGLQRPRPASGLPPASPAAPGASDDANRPATEPASGSSDDADRTTAGSGASLPRRTLLLGVLGAAALASGVAVTLMDHDSSGASGVGDGTSPTTNARRALAVLRCDTPVYSLTFAPGGSTLATGGESGTVLLWDVAARKRTGSLTHLVDGFGGGPINGLAFSPDGRLLASSGGNGALMWNVTARKPSAVLTGVGDPNIGPLAFSPDGKFLVTGGDRGVIRWWDAPGGKLAATRTDPGHSDEAMVAFSRDGKTLLTADINSVRSWDAASKKTTAVITDRTNPVLFGQALTPDRRLFASGETLGEIKLWDLVAKKQIGTMLDDLKPVMALAFSPDGKTLASGNADATTLLWDVATRKISARLTGHTGGVYCAEFSPDGRTLVTGSADKTVRLWGV
ncbi:protein kinase family protein [Streptomyces sp. NPDC001939]